MKKVSLIIPVYNEQEHLNRFLTWVDDADFGLKKELVIIDDKSSDHSAKIIEDFSFKSECQFIQKETNTGKGAALRAGIAKASGDIIGIQDADFEYDINDIPAILELILKNKADIVYGSRFRKDSNQVHRTFHYLVNRFLTIMSNLCSGLYLSDMETCYKFFRSEIIKNIKLESDKFGFEPEITAKIARLKVRISEVPISYYPRSYIEGKKITWQDGVAALRHILYFNFQKTQMAQVYKGMPDRFLTTKAQWL